MSFAGYEASEKAILECIYFDIIILGWEATGLPCEANIALIPWK